MRPTDSLDIPLFAGLTPEERCHVLDCASPLELPAGAVLFVEGEPGDSMYIVAAGEVEILKAMGTAEEHLLAVHQASDFFGEVALLDSQGLRSASARARGGAQVLQITAADFNRLMTARPALAYQMAHFVSERLRKAADVTIRDLEMKNRALAEAYAELQAAHAQIIEKEKLEKELDVARQVQHSMLPEQLPEVEGYTFGALMQAARRVGGDFYDIFSLDQNHIAVVVGDVSDKGVPSALFMALTRSLVRAEALRLDTPANTLRRVNILLNDMSTTGLFVTVLYGVLDRRTGQFIYARAGHELPILRRAGGSLAALSHATGMLMGLFPDIPIDVGTLELRGGDMLLLFSDGASDAANPQGEMLGRERLAQVVQDCPEEPAPAVCNRILKAVRAHQQTAPQFDDITLVAVCACPA